MIVVYGTVCLDRIRQVERLPEKGGYAEILAETDLLGGEAANTAVALAQWGAGPVLASNPIGRGPWAELIVGKLGMAGIETDLVPWSETETPTCDVFVTPDGERTMFGRGFAAMEDRTDPTLFPQAAGAWFTADPNHGTVARAAVVRAQAAGMRAYLLDFLRADDPIGPGDTWQSSTDWIGVRGNTQKNVLWLQEFVAARGCFAVLSDGPNGFVAGGPERPVRHYPPFPCPSMIDSTGAGDMFRAGMLFGLDQGLPLPDCLRFASAAGCLKCRHLGGTSQVPTQAEIEAHIAANPSVGRAYE